MSVRCLPNLLNEQVTTTGLTHEWILNTLVKHDSSFDEAVNGGEVTLITAVDISAGQGFTSKIYKTHVFVNDHKDFVYKCVMKIPTMDRINELTDQMYTEEQKAQKPLYETDKMMDNLVKFHNTECDFYEIFKEINNFPMPKVIYTQKFYPREKQLGLIIMEDLSEQGQTLNFFGTLHVFQIKIIVKHLAAFHAHLLTNKQDYKNRFKSCFYFEEFKEIVMSTLDSLYKFRQGMFETSFKKMEKLCYDMKLAEYIFRGCCEDLSLPQLIQLGDLWTNNVLWEPKPDGSTPNKVLTFIDFQLTFEGNPAFDMARLMTLCTDAEVRRELETFIFDFYYENLTKFLEPTGKKPEFDVGKFKTAYEYAMVNQAIQLTFFLLPFDSTVGMNEGEKIIHEAKIEKLVLRAKLGMDDAIKVLERIQPDWLVDEV